MTRAAPEEGLHKFVVQCLQLYSAKNVIWFHPANEGTSSARRGAKMKALGVVAGVPDFVVVGNDAVARFLELKSPKGRLSPAQLAFASRAQRSGCAYIVAKSPEEAVNALLTWGALTCDPLRRAEGIAA